MSPVEVHESRGKSVVTSVKDLKELTGSFNVCETDKKTFWFSDLCIYSS